MALIWRVKRPIRRCSTVYSDCPSWTRRSAFRKLWNTDMSMIISFHTSLLTRHFASRKKQNAWFGYRALLVEAHHNEISALECPHNSRASRAGGTLPLFHGDVARAGLVDAQLAVFARAGEILAARWPRQAEYLVGVTGQCDFRRGGVGGRQERQVPDLDGHVVRGGREHVRSQRVKFDQVDLVGVSLYHVPRLIGGLRQAGFRYFPQPNHSVVAS